MLFVNDSDMKLHEHDHDSSVTTVISNIFQLDGNTSLNKSVSSGASDVFQLDGNISSVDHSSNIPVIISSRSSSFVDQKDLLLINISGRIRIFMKHSTFLHLQSTTCEVFGPRFIIWAKTSLSAMLTLVSSVRSGSIRKASSIKLLLKNFWNLMKSLIFKLLDQMLGEGEELQ